MSLSDIANAPAQLLDTLRAAIQDGDTVFITESHTDATLLQNLGLPAICAKDPNEYEVVPPSFFTGAQIVVLHGNSESGNQFASYIRDVLRHYAHSIRTGAICDAASDNVSSFLSATSFDRTAFEQAVFSMQPTYAPWVEQTSKGLKINADKLAHSIGRNVAFLNVRQSGDVKYHLLLFRHGRYVNAADADMKAMIRRYLPVGYGKASLLTEVEKLLLCREEKTCSLMDLDADTGYINFRNGLLNIETMELEKHSPKIRSTLQISCDYAPDDQNMPVFRRFLTSLCTDETGHFDEERESILQEFCGLAISNLPGRYLKKVMLLYSPEGNTGKSQVLGLLNNLVGIDHVANVSMQDLGSGNRFSLGPVIGKRLICVGDQSGSTIRDSSIFKQITGGDVIRAEEKYQNPQMLLWNGAILFACNSLPTFKDDYGEHMFERFQILPCDNVIAESERDPEILPSILKEKPAIVNWMLNGLLRLIKNNYKFSPCAASVAVMTEYRLRQDTVFAFLSSRYCITKREQDRVEKAIIQEEYMAWCAENNMDSVSRRDFNRRLEGIGLRVKQARFGTRGGIMAVCGLKRKTPIVAVA